MNQKQFTELADHQIYDLLELDTKIECWQAGYLYAMEQVEKILDENSDKIACVKLQEIVDECQFLDYYE